MKRILITGGSGFIARNLKEELARDYEIFAPSSSELNLLDASLVYDFLSDKRFEVVIHSATYDAAPLGSLKDPNKVLEYNLKMFFNLVRAKKFFGKMIFFGSGAEYSREHWVPKMKEDYFDQYVPGDQYGFSKYLMTKYALVSEGIFNLRLFAVFGEYEDWRYRFISNICAKAVLNLPIVVNENKIFDFLYVKDLTRIVKWFIEHEPSRKVYNVCSGEGQVFSSLAEKVVEISGKPIEVIIKSKEVVEEYTGDNSLLLREMGGFKFTPIDQALKSLYNWYEKNKSSIDKEKFHY